MTRDRRKRYWQAPEKRARGRSLPVLAGEDRLATEPDAAERGVGRAYWYASVCGACAAGCGILAKGRDGRPIKLEGTPEHPLSRGGLCAVGQASVLSLYDSKRLRQPLSGREAASWPEVDQAIDETLASLRASGGRVRVLTDSVTGPAEEEQIAAFLSQFQDGRHVIYDPISSSAVADAHRETHGARVIPRYRFERAEVIVSLGADFLGTWISPVEHAAGYQAGRRLTGNRVRFSYHVQIESRMSLTGSNADGRIGVPPGTTAVILAHLAGGLARENGERPPWTTLPPCPVEPEELAGLVDRLWKGRRGRTLVVCGDNDVTAQRLANYANHLLGNYGGTANATTLDLESVSSQRRGDDGELRTLLREIEDGKVDALFVRGVNPVYDLPSGDLLAEALEKMKLVVSFGGHEEETARHAHFVCPEPHHLESWGDAEPVAGVASVRQPAMRPMGSTRPMMESLAVWSGRPGTAYEMVRRSWQRNVYPRRREGSSFEAFWNQALHDGFVRVRPAPGAGGGRYRRFNLAAVTVPSSWSPPAENELLLELHPSAGVMDGRHAFNPWLQELPDPIAKTVWDNSAALAPALAERLGIETGDVVRITPAEGPEAAVEVAALVQPGQHRQSVALALGYGRQGTERFAKVGPQWWEGSPTVEEGGLVGASAAPLLSWTAAALTYAGRRVRVEKTGRSQVLATTQVHHTLAVPPRLAMGHNEHRPIVQETTLAAWREDPAAGRHGHHELASLWPEHPMSPHHWGMAVDLAACTGCSACVMACQAENNIPVVGKDEVRRAREMHWMRIDRYYSGEESDVEVVHMPMMCQHCDNAPCETVCPVQATAQSAEGLNQQVYNRCVGTRYCANNCPYKVRRFNWFHYPREDRLQNLALNPDVTVRSRGVMEKCSLCVQRIQDAKAEAKRADRELRDGEIQPACAQSCPAGAIVFGDMNDPDSRLSRLKHDPRHYEVLAELGIKPVVGYLTLVRNRHDG
jgi:molybdopterin-containing oxidoreductase family iron-sulfur binding subunit